MLKKIFLVCFLMATLFVRGGHIESVSYASEICTTEEECAQMINETLNEISALEAQEAGVQAEINVTEEDMAETRERISQTEGAISTLQENIAELQHNISLKETEIETSEAELAQLDVEIEQLNELIAGRMRLTQRMNNNNTVLEVLSESDSFVDLIRRFRVINHLSQSDSDMMDELRELIEQQQTLLETLQVQMADLSTQRTELSTQKEALEAESAMLAVYQAQLEEQQEALEQQMQEIRDAMLSADEALQIAREQQQVLENTPVPEVVVPSAGGVLPPEETPTESTDTESNVGSNVDSNSNTESSQIVTPPPTVANQMFIIPLERGRVSFEFGAWVNHTGIDLANGGDTSTRVLAAAAGVVTRSGWHDMYGNHVIITHNINGQIYTTLYAHLHQTPFVSVGQTVSQGDVLGTMGNTGNSFGAHLHFEIYIGHFNWPHAVNPRQFIHFPSSW